MNVWGRTPEPELMMDEEQAAAYANADLSEPSSRALVTQFRERVWVECPREGCSTWVVAARTLTIRFATTSSAGTAFEGNPVLKPPAFRTAWRPNRNIASEPSLQVP